MARVPGGLSDRLADLVRDHRSGRVERIAPGQARGYASGIGDDIHVVVLRHPDRDQIGGRHLLEVLGTVWPARIQPRHVRSGDRFVTIQVDHSEQARRIPPLPALPGELARQRIGPGGVGDAAVVTAPQDREHPPGRRLCLVHAVEE